MASAQTTAGRWRGLAPIGGMGGLALIGPPIGGLVILGSLTTLGPWLNGLDWLGLALYMIGFIVFAGLALLPTYAQAVLGGWAFGVVWGVPAALVGFAGGSLLAYALGRPIAGRRLVDRIEASPRWRAIHDALVKSSRARATLIVTLIRVPPTSPFALTNVALTSALVPWPAYLIGTVVGLGPRTGAAVVAGAGLSRLDYAHLTSSPSNWSIVVALATTLGVFFILSLMARWALRNMTAAAETRSTQAFDRSATEQRTQRQGEPA